MLHIARSGGRGVALAIVGLVFLLIGLERHQNGGSVAFVPIGGALILLGLRRLRRAVPDPIA